MSARRQSMRRVEEVRSSWSQSAVTSILLDARNPWREEVPNFCRLATERYDATERTSLINALADLADCVACEERTPRKKFARDLYRERTNIRRKVQETDPTSNPESAFFGDLSTEAMELLTELAELTIESPRRDPQRGRRESTAGRSNAERRRSRGGDGGRRSARSNGRRRFVDQSAEAETNERRRLQMRINCLLADAKHDETLQDVETTVDWSAVRARRLDRTRFVRAKTAPRKSRGDRVSALRIASNRVRSFSEDPSCCGLS